MASRAHNLVLRDLRAAALSARLRIFDPRFNYCFNSYYEAQGPRQPRPQRGLLTRPTAEEVRDYRAHVDDALRRFFQRRAGGRRGDPEAHRDRHPSRAAASGAVAHRHLEPVRREPAAPGLSRGRARCARRASPSRCALSPSTAASSPSAMTEPASHSTMRDRATTCCCAHSSSPTASSTNAEWSAFIEDGGYRTPSLWLADGWARGRSRRLARAALLGGARRAVACR